eukprot:3247410-Rhodomonas_salina.3
MPCRHWMLHRAEEDIITRRQINAREISQGIAHHVRRQVGTRIASRTTLSENPIFSSREGERVVSIRPWQHPTPTECWAWRRKRIGRLPTSTIAVVSECCFSAAWSCSISCVSPEHRARIVQADTTCFANALDFDATVLILCSGGPGIAFIRTCKGVKLFSCSCSPQSPSLPLPI